MKQLSLLNWTHDYRDRYLQTLTYDLIGQYRFYPITYTMVMEIEYRANQMIKEYEETRNVHIGRVKCRVSGDYNLLYLEVIDVPVDKEED